MTVESREEAAQHVFTVQQLLDTSDLDLRRIEQDLAFTIEISLAAAGAVALYFQSVP